MKIQTRSLYQCGNARVIGGTPKEFEIVCSAGHKLSGNYYLALARGKPLEFTICQKCLDYDEMGEPVEPQDRGWLRDE